MSCKYGVELAVADKSDEAVYVGSGGEITKLTNIRAAEAGHLHVSLKPQDPSKLTVCLFTCYGLTFSVWFARPQVLRIVKTASSLCP